MLSSPESPSSNRFADTVLSVAELNRQVRDCLERRFPLLQVRGEISNLTYAASGHVYFSLKDEAAQVRCVMWRSRAQTLGRRLSNGQQVDIRALVSFYEPRGEFQLNVESLRQAGQGDLYEQFLRLKARLEAEGLFEASRKRPLPGFPRRLAIVTSPQAAALRDVLTTLARRSPHVAVRLYPAPVQGEGASMQLAAALAKADGEGHDVILLCRGGGSIEDLWAFNEEPLARQIAACRTPVVSGVGHETDFTMADFVADVRAATPTAAAELACPDRAMLLRRVEEWQGRLARRTRQHLFQLAQNFDQLSLQLRHPAQHLAARRDEVKRLETRLDLGCQRQQQERQYRLSLLEQRLRQQRPEAVVRQNRVDQLRYRLKNLLERELLAVKGQLNALEAGLVQLNPHAVLTRGYAYALDDSGRAVRDARDLQQGQGLRLHFARGEARVEVSDIAGQDVVVPPEAS